MQQNVKKEEQKE